MRERERVCNRIHVRSIMCRENHQLIIKSVVGVYGNLNALHARKATKRLREDMENSQVLPFDVLESQVFQEAQTESIK